MYFYYKISDILSPHIVGFFLSFLRSFEHTNKNLLLSPQIFLLNIHDFEINPFDLHRTLPLQSSQNYISIHIFIKD